MGEVCAWGRCVHREGVHRGGVCVHKIADTTFTTNLMRKIYTLISTSHSFPTTAGRI